MKIPQSRNLRSATIVNFSATIAQNSSIKYKLLKKALFFRFLLYWLFSLLFALGLWLWLRLLLLGVIPSRDDVLDVGGTTR
jgi:hypothetical protein